MKKILIALLTVSSVCLAQHPALDLYSTRLTAGRPFFTDEGIYNSYHFFNSPIGVFEIDSSSLNLEAGYSLFSLDYEKRNYLSMPVLRMGEPSRAYFQVSYGYDILSYVTSEDENMSLPLHRFGLTLAAQSESGLFQASIMSSGYIGTQRWDIGDSTRALLGLENLRFDFGSRVHPMARVGIFIGAGLHVDTLNSFRAIGQLPRDDRSAHVVLPAFGGFVDFGDKIIPARSHLSLQYASSRFVYVSKNGAGREGIDGLGNEYSIMNDSLQLLWLTAGRVPLGEHFAKPGLLLGFSTNAGKLHYPDEDSDPFNIGHPIPGGDFDLTEVYFGIGSGFEVFNYADFFMEYVYNSASLNYGNHSGFLNPTGFPTSHGLHHFALGVSTPLHNYISTPLNLTPRIAYFISESAGAVQARRMNTRPLNPERYKSARYQPQRYLENKESTSGFTLGLDIQSSNEKFGGSIHTTFLNESYRGEAGVEMGLVFTIVIPGSSSGFSE